ncbi:MAG: class E sortase [Coriobacteriales bacterium]|nr:class E sortase [Coriobacteriales bacterium]
MQVLRKIRIPAVFALLAIGAAVALYPQITEWRYARAQEALASEAAGIEASARTAEGGQPMPEGAVALISIAAIDLDAYVLEGVEPAQLNRSVGHYPKTVLPGEQGNAGLAGHRTMYGHPFRRLDELEPGDVSETWTERRHETYRVTQTLRVEPTRVDVIAPTEGRRITLTTCNPVGSARERLVVVGEASR